MRRRKGTCQGIFLIWLKSEVLVAESHPTLCNPVDSVSRPGSSVHGIVQARTLEWATRGSSQPRGWTQVSCIAGRFFTIWATWEAWSRSCHSVTQSCLTLRPHGLQHARLPCPLASPRTCSNSRASCCWCHPTISSSASNLLLSVFASIRVFSNELFASGGQRIGASVLVLLMNIQDWFPLGLTSLILQSKVLGNAKKREM